MIINNTIQKLDIKNNPSFWRGMKIENEHVYYLLELSNFDRHFREKKIFKGFEDSENRYNLPVKWTRYSYYNRNKNFTVCKISNKIFNRWLDTVYYADNS